MLNRSAVLEGLGAAQWVESQTWLSFLILVLLPLLLLLLLLQNHISLLRRRCSQGASGPRGWPVVGNLPELLLKGERECIRRWILQFGELFVFHLGLKEVLVVADPDLAKEVLVRKFKSLRNRATLETLADEQLQGIIFNRGKQWSAARNASLPLFHNQQHLQLYMQLMTDAISHTSQELSLISSDTLTDVTPLLQEMTFSVFSAAAFGGPPVGTSGTDAVKIIKASEVTLRLLSQHSVTSVATLFLGRTAASFIFRLMSAVPHTTEWELAQNIRFRESVGETLLASRGVWGRENAKDLVGELLRAQARAQEGEVQLTDSEVLWVVSDLIIAGSETTANTLSFAIFLLCAHPHCEAKLLEEIKLHGGAQLLQRGLQNGQPAPSPSPLSLQELHNFPFAAMVVKEALRIYPVASTLLQEANEDVTLGSVKVPQGGTVYVPSLHMHHSAANFSDPEMFNPERFDSRGGNDSSASPAYLPFGAGPRMCLGAKFAQQEAVLALVLLYARHTFALAGELKGLKGAEAMRALKVSEGLVFKPKSGV